MKITSINNEVIDQGKRLGDPQKLVADIGAIKKATGWEPKTSLHDGLAQTIEYYKKYL